MNQSYDFPDAEATEMPENSISASSLDAPMVQPPPGPNHDERLAVLREAGARGENVLLLASSDLLRTLAEMPAQLDGPQLLTWRKLLEDALIEFTRLCEQLNLRREHMLAARYVLCTALDEAASLSPWNTQGDQAGRWANMALLPQFHGEREGGEVVFMLLGRLANAQQEHMDVLELVHHVLSLGFTGRYRTAPDGHRQLEAIRYRLFTMVSSTQEPVPRELSENWRGVSPGKFRLLRSVPVWASASVLTLALLAQYGWSQYQLLTTSTSLEKRIEALRQMQPEVPAAPAEPEPPPALGLAQLLAADITKGLVAVDERPGRSLVVFKGDGMFARGQATLTPKVTQIVMKVGQAIQAVPGQVLVTGHTDNLPLNDPNGINREISLRRAQQVAKVLQAQGVNASRLVIEGKGAQAPVASNDTAAGRAQNRRVEIEVRTSQN